MSAPPDCTKCGERPSSHHIVQLHKRDKRLCCRCYVAEGNPPSDWHDGCMKAFAEGRSGPKKPERDATKSAQARDAGMVQATLARTVTESWKLTALKAIRTVASRREELVSADVVELLHEWEQPPPEGSKVMGPLMRRAANLGYITGPIRTQVSDRVTHHRGLENVWQSKVYGR